MELVCLMAVCIMPSKINSVSNLLNDLENQSIEWIIKVLLSYKVL